MPVFDILKRFVGTAATSERRGDDRLRASLGARVLVVDDSATIRAVLGKMLAQDGYEVLKAPDGENAVEMAQSQFPDLIFLDIVLPGMSGFAVLRALRRDTRTRTTPIIMMSGNQQATEQFYVQRFGADGFIKKPFGRAEVFHSIRSLVQAGRMAGRAETLAADAIPEGMTPEEWDSIPDVAMPDEAHAAGHPVVLDVEPVEAPMHVDAPAAVASAAPAVEADAAPVASAPAVPPVAAVAVASEASHVDAAPAPVAEGQALPVEVGEVADTDVVPAISSSDAATPLAAASMVPEPEPVAMPESTQPPVAPATPAQASIPFQVVQPADAHADPKHGFSSFWSLRTFGLKMHPSVTTAASKGGVKFDVNVPSAATPAKSDEAARK